MPKPPSRFTSNRLNPLATPLAGRISRFNELLAKIHPCPPEWLKTPTGAPKSGNSLALIDCQYYEQVIDAWKVAFTWTPGLDRALACMLSSVVSTMQVGSQLWFKVMGPPSCGKTSLCEALTTCEDYVIAKSTLRGFHSGYDAGDGSDNALIDRLRGKTFITKDGDTLLQAPNLGQILSEARDIYDTVSRTSYRNKASADYSGVRMTWLLCGTSSLRSIDDSELGERFLDCVIMDGVDNELEDQILPKVARTAIQNMGIEFDGSAAKQYSPELINAMCLTGGYVKWLREEGKDNFGELRWSDAAVKRCVDLGKFVAYMRARPSSKQSETEEREFGARLVEQHVRLASSLAVVMNKQTIDTEVMDRTTQIALDTGRGPVLDMAKRMSTSADGLSNQAISMITSLDHNKTARLTRFLNKIDAIKRVKVPRKSGRGGTTNNWQLTSVVRNLVREVVPKD